MPHCIVWSSFGRAVLHGFGEVVSYRLAFGDVSCTQSLSLNFFCGNRPQAIKKIPVILSALTSGHRADVRQTPKVRPTKRNRIFPFLRILVVFIVFIDFKIVKIYLK